MSVWTNRRRDGVHTDTGQLRTESLNRSDLLEYDHEKHENCRIWMVPFLLDIDIDTAIYFATGVDGGASFINSPQAGRI